MMTQYVFNCLKNGYAISAIDVLNTLKKARLKVTEDEIDDALVKLLDEGKIEAVGKGYRRA